METEKDYPFKTVPYKHQLTTWLRSRALKAFALLLEMGLGKTKVLLDTAAWLFDQSLINALVVIAPKGVYRLWGDSEIPSHLPDHIDRRVGVWASDSKAADRQSLALLVQPFQGLKVLLMNVEALGRDLDSNKAFAFLQEFLEKNRCLMAVDESTAIKNPQATRTKAVLKLRGLAPYRRILSGQPAVNGPLDLYSQCAFLGAQLLGWSSFFAYKAHFAKLVPMTMRLGVDPKTGRMRERKFSIVKGYRNLDELHETLSKFASIVKKEDCLDLPPKVFVQRHVELGKQQRAAYDQMRKLAIVEIDKAMGRQAAAQEFELQASDAPIDLDPAKTATATLVITQMMRLHQILCGFVVNDLRQPVLFDEPNARLDSLMDLLAETQGKVVIWATYRVSVRQIRDRIAEEYGPESVLTFYGDSDAEERAAVGRAFNPTHPAYDPDGPVRFVVSNKTGARGNTWTASHTAVYYTFDHDLDIHDQSQDRIHRIGQSTSCLYIYMVAPGTLEDKILAALQSKQDISRLITASNWKSWL